MSVIKVKIKKGDDAVVVSGSYKGTQGKVTKILPEKSKVYLEGVRVVRRNMRPTQQNPDGYKNIEVPFHISNVAVVDPTTNSSGKVGYKLSKDGNKVRFFKKTNTELLNR